MTFCCSISTHLHQYLHFTRHSNAVVLRDCVECGDIMWCVERWCGVLRDGVEC